MLPTINATLGGSSLTSSSLFCSCGALTTKNRRRASTTRSPTWHMHFGLLYFECVFLSCLFAIRNKQTRPIIPCFIWVKGNIHFFVSHIKIWYPITIFNRFDIQIVLCLVITSVMYPCFSFPWWRIRIINYEVMLIRSFSKIIFLTSRYGYKSKNQYRQHFHI